MTMALCFNCGDVKFGAICPCPKCQVTSSGDMGLDIAFSDHNYAVETLEEFGSVIRSIHAATDDESVRFWTFIRFVSEHHPGILQVELEPGLQTKASQLLREIDLPSVTLRESPMRRFKAKQDGEA